MISRHSPRLDIALPRPPPGCSIKAARTATATWPCEVHHVYGWDRRWHGRMWRSYTLDDHDYGDDLPGDQPSSGRAPTRQVRLNWQEMIFDPSLTFGESSGCAGGSCASAASRAWSADSKEWSSTARGQDGSDASCASVRVRVACVLG